MRDSQGREYAKLHDLEAGMCVEVDDGFDCMRARSKLEVKRCRCGALYVDCDDERHHLDGQQGNGDYLVGIYRAPAN